MSEEEALILDIRSYAARFGVTLEEAMRRVLIMAGTGDEIAALGGEFGDELSGVYFDNAADFGLKVKLTSSEKKQPRKLERKADRSAARQERKAARQANRTETSGSASKAQD